MRCCGAVPGTGTWRPNARGLVPAIGGGSKGVYGALTGRGFKGPARLRREPHRALKRRRDNAIQ